MGPKYLSEIFSVSRHLIDIKTPEDSPNICQYKIFPKIKVENIKCTSE